MRDSPGAMFIFFAFIAILSTVGAAIDGRRSFTPLDLVQLDRISGLAVSPNGQLAVVAKSKYNPEHNKSIRNLHLINITASTTTPITPYTPETSHDSPLFLDDSHIAFLAADSNKISQVHVLDISEPDHEPYILTSFPVDISNIKYHVPSKTLAFSAQVYTNGTLDDAARRDAENENRYDSALVYDNLMVRHWDNFVSEKKNNIFVIALDFSEGKYITKGDENNIMKGSGLESPILPFGDADNFNFSPLGDGIVFVAKVPGRKSAWETSQHIFIVPTSGALEPLALNSDIHATSSSPIYSPDGSTIAYLQMLVPKYEADRNRITLYNTKTRKRRTLIGHWDHSPSSIIFSVDSKWLFVTAEDRGRVKIFSIEIASESIHPITHEHSSSSVLVLNEESLIFTQSSMTSPAEVFTANVHVRDIHKVTNFHGDTLAELDLPAPEEFWFKGAKGDRVHGWIIKPAGYEKGKKYPLAFLIHGGPQGAWNDAFSTRWNPEIFAGAGFAVVAINPRGSTGYGQSFQDAIHHNWGSLPYEDLDKGLTHVIRTYHFIDERRVAGLGASFGGYMVNWINGHSRRFRALVNHDGAFSTVNVFYTTEELYFCEVEFGGPAYSPSARKIYDMWSPEKFVRNWRTPTLVIHGRNDYRLVDGEGLSTFTALQRQNVPSRLVYFPDENHWVLKPANSLRWHHEVLEWITEWTSEDKVLETEEQFRAYPMEEILMGGDLDEIENDTYIKIAPKLHVQMPIRY